METKEPEQKTITIKVRRFRIRLGPICRHPMRVVNSLLTKTKLFFHVHEWEDHYLYGSPWSKNQKCKKPGCWSFRGWDGAKWHKVD